MQPKIDGLSIAALALILFLSASLLTEATSAEASFEPAAPETAAQETAAQDPAADAALIAPYETYTLTQGPHGQSYGHLAIDLAAGEGATIRAPIQGIVSELYEDVYGNPTLVIENEVYRVTLMHGNYTVAPGQSVALGEAVGTEDNQGYTTDLNGNLCYEQAGCGFHTHMNVYDKRIQANVNPLDLLK